jgi:hypothetical protein
MEREMEVERNGVKHSFERRKEEDKTNQRQRVRNTMETFSLAK